jgi:hypothetical protein
VGLVDRATSKSPNRGDGWARSMVGLELFSADGVPLRSSGEEGGLLVVLETPPPFNKGESKT